MNQPSKSRKKAVRMAKLLSRFPGSGLNVKQYCKHHRISLFQYYYWQRRLKADALPSDQKAQPSFLKVSGLDIPRPTGVYELFLPDGLRLRIPPDFDQRSLSALLSVLSC